MTIKQALNLAKQDLDSIEARVLIEYILKKDNTYIIANSDFEISKSEEKDLLNYLDKIKNGYPLQYITNHQEFMGLDFYVDENVLIPQPDTEVLVEYAIKLAIDFTKKIDNTNKCLNEKEDFQSNIKTLDLCTGSGAIAVSIKKYFPSATVFASDISKNALEIAKENAKKNNVEINFIESNMFKNINEKFDIIVSNPPYISSLEIPKLSKQVQNEPKIALDGGLDGLDFYRIISKEITKFLNKNGILLLEIGYDQASKVKELFNNSKIIKDYANNDRVVVWKNS